MNNINEAGVISLNNAMIWNQTLTYLQLDNDILLDDMYYAFNDNSIVLKNQSLYALLIQSFKRTRYI